MVKKARKKSPKKSVRKKQGKKAWIIILILPLLAALGYFAYKGIRKTNNRLKKSELLLSIPEGYSSVGIDVSHHQGEIDWNHIFNTLRYDTIIRFVYCKATEGLTHVDTKWWRNRSQLNGMGIMNGAYHFFAPKDRPREQAAHFLAYWKAREIDLPPMLDVENEGFSDEDLIAKMKIWLQEVEAQTGYRPIIYTSLNFYETKFRDKFPGYYFWIAAYNREPDLKNDKQIIHWQFSETGQIPGIKEKVDLNVSKVLF